MSNNESPFTYRTWSVSTFHNYELLERTLDRALVEAPRHGVTCIELQDYCGSWIDLGATYADYPRLRDADLLHIPGGPWTAEQREERRAFLKRLAGKVKDAGLELQVWHHCFRDWPKEATQWYPQLADADGREMYDFITSTVSDAFDTFGEINGITLTSLHETPSIIRLDGDTPLPARLLRLYRVYAEACEKRNRRLIIRDFIVRKSGFDLFDQVMDQLPDWVWVQTKDVVADWGAHEKPFNHFVFRYARKAKPLVVEFELANNFAGEMEIPWCHPEYLWRRIRLMAELSLHGGVGRLVNTDRVTAGTIFDTANEVMVWAFSRFLLHPGKLLKKAEDEWDRFYDQFDVGVYREWAEHRFGAEAAAEVVTLCRRTPRMVDLTINHCGAHFLCGRFNFEDTSANREWFKRLLTHPYRSMPGVVRAIDRGGADLAMAEKREAMRIVTHCLEDIERLRDRLTAEGYALLHTAFDRGRCLIVIYQAMIQAVVSAMAVDAGEAPSQELRTRTDALRAAGDAAKEAHGPRLYESTPVTAHVVADFIDEMPGRIEEFRRIADNAAQ